MREWKSTNSAAARPIILEKGGGSYQAVHVYVVWDEWDQRSQLERSEIIMDSYEEVQGQNGSQNVTVGMGLTPIEAERRGIRYKSFFGGETFGHDLDHFQGPQPRSHFSRASRFEDKRHLRSARGAVLRRRPADGAGHLRSA